MRAPKFLLVQKALKPRLFGIYFEMKTMLRLSIDEEISPIWRPIIEHQVAMTLSSLSSALCSLRIDFEQVGDIEAGRISYRCEFRGRSNGGRMYTSFAQHPDGQTAIADTLNRAKRTIVRERRMAALTR